MTLFITTPKRQFEIHDAYPMALCFLISFAVGKIVKAVIEKQKRKRQIVNPRGGDTIGLEIEISDDTELAKMILSCISDNERYLIKDPIIIQIVFNLVKAKIKQESLAISPNLMRFLALTLISRDQTLIVKIGNIFASSNNQIRFLVRLMGSTTIGFIAALMSSLPYAILIMIFYFDITADCGYNCSDYFEKLPKEGAVRIYSEESTGHIFIGANDDAQQITIYTPSKAAKEVSVSSDGSVRTTKQHFKKARSKVKKVEFSDFRNTDPILSRFSDLEEPDVPQKSCQINDIHDALRIRID